MSLKVFIPSKYLSFCCKFTCTNNGKEKNVSQNEGLILTSSDVALSGPLAILSMSFILVNGYKVKWGLKYNLELMVISQS